MVPFLELSPCFVQWRKLSSSRRSIWQANRKTASSESFSSFPYHHMSYANYLSQVCSSLLSSVEGHFGNHHSGRHLCIPLSICVFSSPSLRFSFLPFSLLPFSFLSLPFPALSFLFTLSYLRFLSHPLPSLSLLSATHGERNFLRIYSVLFFFLVQNIRKLARKAVNSISVHS